MISKGVCVGIMLLWGVTAYGADLKQRPPSIEELFDSFLREYVELCPETGTTLGLPDALGIKVRNDELNDVSDRGQDRLLRFFKKYRDWLPEYDRATMTEGQRIAADILKWHLDLEIENDRFRYHDYVINPMFGFHNSLTTLMTEHHQIKTARDALDYIGRLRKYPRRFFQLQQQIGIREKKGMLPPVFIIQLMHETCRDFIKTAPVENILYTSFFERVSQIETLDDRAKAKLCNRAFEAVRDEVYPSYETMVRELDRLARKADSTAGVGKLPNGADYYRLCLQRHTTTSMTPDEIHRLGLKEVQRIHGEIEALWDSLKIPPGNTFLERYGQYWAISRSEGSGLLYPATEEGRAQTIRDYQAIVDEMARRLPEMFAVVPRTPVRVEPVPAFKERTAGTYYQPPRLDGSTPGTFYANLSYRHHKPGMKTLAYHEAIPGHHLQIVLEHERGGSKPFKTLLFFTGFVEGWALYSERLARDFGFFDDPYSLLGYLASELFRAVRLVVDTGIHSKGWTKEDAYRYMRDNVGWASYGEIDRYIVWPGQACAYKIGELKLLELREKARRALGDRLDSKEFHRIVLEHGSMPLAMLEEIIDKYIEERR